ncbi:MAG TPA: hypothetical protein VEZ44_13675 [bacterium]|nr:hypothetical protein [bacterium]
MRAIGWAAPRRAPAGLGWGAAAAALYLAVSGMLGAHSPRLLYDGLVPLPPYQWVHPPGGGSSSPPPGATGMVALAGGGSSAAEISTDDLQATITFPQGAVASRPGEASVKVTITPLDAATVAPAPNGRRFDSNGYRFEVVYAASGTPAELAKPVDIALTYAAHATVILRAQGQEKAWTVLRGPAFPASQQIVVHTDRLGTFVASP